MQHRVRTYVAVAHAEMYIYTYTYATVRTQVCQLVLCGEEIQKKTTEENGGRNIGKTSGHSGDQMNSQFARTLVQRWQLKSAAKNELASEQLTSEQLVEKAAWTVLYVSRLFGVRCSAQSCLMGDQRMYMLRAAELVLLFTAPPASDRVAPRIRSDGSNLKLGLQMSFASSLACEVGWRLWLGLVASVVVVLVPGV